MAKRRRRLFQEGQAAYARAMQTPLLEQLRPFLRFLRRRFSETRVEQAAAALSYTSLLATVPLMAIGFSMFAIFPGLEQARDEVYGFIFQNFAPHMEGTIKEELTSFAANARKLTTVGLLVLFATAVMLLSTIEKTFNQIWRVTVPRKLVPRLLAYWAAITLGPILIGAGLSISGYLYAATEWFDSEYVENIRLFLRFLPFVLEACAIALLYIVIPNRDVNWRDALIGAAVAAFLFEVAKKGFGIYLATFQTYEAIYGALAAVPIFLIWMFVSWFAVLAGGLVAAAIGDWRKGSPETP
ncbi:MAG: YihY family inner membrane protein [Alphaproteobacteria bacterium]|nr:YihY family inner membrane protein [Alphaproteobacteria bacterium]